jgi:paraquat-inducible protein B
LINFKAIHDLKAKASAERALNAKVQDGERQIHELQKAKEKLARVIVKKEVFAAQDTTSVIHNLQKQLNEKTRESESVENLLTQTQNPLSPMMETTIPRLKAQIANLQRERDAVVKKIRRLVQSERTWNTLLNEMRNHRR